MAMPIPRLAGSSKTFLTDQATRQMKPDEWTNCTLRHLRSMQSALQALYNGIDFQEDGLDQDAESDAIAASENMLSISGLARVFSESCRDFCILISEPSPSQVKLPVWRAVKIVSKCLRISYSDVKSMPSMSKLAEVIPILHQSALDTMTQLVSSCKTNLLPQSWTIINMCLQALTSTLQMEQPNKSKTRACAYRTLCQVIKTFGYGRNFSSQAKSIIQALAVDIKWQDDLKQEPLVITDQSKQDVDPGHHKKGKKKKRNKAESYGDLAGAGAQAGANGKDTRPRNVGATLGALELSKMILEREGYPSVERLTQCILDTISNMRRNAPSLTSPYRESRCRKCLYDNIFACAMVRLNPGARRDDVIYHFQMRNKALYTLSGGLFDSSLEVSLTCQQALYIAKLSSIQNLSIVRRILPEESNDTKDAMELEREVLKLTDETESLKKRLLESELENQGQSRLVASLRQEIESLRSLATKKESSAKSIDGEAVNKESSQKDSSEEDDDDDESSDDGGDHVKEAREGQGSSTTQIENESRLEEKNVVHNSQIMKGAESGVCKTQEFVKSDRNSAESASDSVDSRDKRKRAADPNPRSPGKRKKFEADLDNNNSSKTDKVQVASSSKTVERDDSDIDIQAMIADFVDIGPD